MSRSTIDFGIDLGTTNSSISVIEGASSKPIRNNEGDEVTPSVVRMTEDGEVIVGRAAKERMHDDSANTHAEFKRYMGSDHAFHFERADVQRKPEELSAEVLKEMKKQVAQRMGETVRAAVISVPAAFDLTQCDATRKAAELAGIEVSPLVQEPVAAALAYGFQEQSDNVFWLVYDLGGGTFDAAIIHSKEGVIQVVDHGGDNHLGGKEIDWKIVDEFLIPQLKQEFDLASVSRSDPRWKSLYAKLKGLAETAKIELSSRESTTILEDFLGEDENGERVWIDTKLTRNDLEKWLAPILRRSLRICNKVIEESNLDRASIERAIMVGGPTLTPYIREGLEDKSEGLGIPIDFTVDPMTIVSRGAAVFASTQKAPSRSTKPVPSGTFEVKFLDFDPVGPDQDPILAGSVSGPFEGNSAEGYSLEIHNETASPAWHSGKVQLRDAGGFMTDLWAERGNKNEYSIDLFDPQGTKLKVVHETLVYTVGQVISQQPLIHSIGIALADNRVKRLFEKGSGLPNESSTLLRTEESVEPSSMSEGIRIPLVEGESSLADRNALIGALVIPPGELKGKVPARTEIEYKLHIDESRLLRAEAYIPLIDQLVENVIHIGSDDPDPDALQEDFAYQKERLRKLQGPEDEPQSEEDSSRIEDLESELETSLQRGEDSDERKKSADRLRELKSTIDEIEDQVAWPLLVERAEEELERTSELLEAMGTADEKQQGEELSQSVRHGIESEDPMILRQSVENLATFRMRVMMDKDAFWVMFYQSLVEDQAKFRDKSTAKRVISQGDQALNRGDIEGVKIAVQQLLSLLPAEERSSVQSKFGTAFGSTVIDDQS